MSLASLIYVLIAMLFTTLAWLLWWRAVPPVIARRGRWPALGPWLLGMAMALLVTGKLDLAASGAPLRWMPLLADLCLIGAAIAELARAHAIGPIRWGRLRPGVAETFE